MIIDSWYTPKVKEMSGLQLIVIIGSSVYVSHTRTDHNDHFFVKETISSTKKMKEVPNMSTGTVKWFNNEKGYGFIQVDGSNRDIFAHYTNIAGQGFRTLEEGQKVEFEIGEGKKGQQAEHILVLW